MPWTPMAVSASRTSSSLNGLMIAITIFMLIASFFPAAVHSAAADQPALKQVLCQNRSNRAVDTCRELSPARAKFGSGTRGKGDDACGARRPTASTVRRRAGRNNSSRSRLPINSSM
jgi:hypothetical protein